MGCDIHLHQEVKVGGVWEHFGMRDIPRNYMLFSKMAGVRRIDAIEPISPPKGFPDRMTRITVLDSTRDNYHSFSWLNAREIAELYDWIREQHWVGPSPGLDWEEAAFGYFFGNTWGGFHKYGAKSGTPEWIEDIRWVFWFDN